MPTPERAFMLSSAATRRRWRYALLTALPLLAVAAAPGARAGEAPTPRFDARSTEQFSRSYQALVAALPASDVVPLELAVERTLRSEALTSGRVLGEADLLRLFDGKTPAEVLAAAPAAEPAAAPWGASGR